MDETYEDLSLWEKVSYKTNQLKEDFLHLSLWQKITLLTVGSILITILFYTFFTVTKLSQIKKYDQPPYVTDQSSAPGTKNNSAQQDNKDTFNQLQTGLETAVINKSSQSASTTVAMPTPQTTNDGVVNFIQNLLGGSSQSSSGTTSTGGTTNTTGNTNTQNSQTSQSQSQQSTSVPTQPYIVNFLNGLLYFQDPTTGVVAPYILSGVNPADFTWGRYTNSTDGYSIEYPTNWTMIKRNDGGHEGLSIYPPTENPQSNDAKQIGLGWSARYLLPTAGGSEIYYQTSITISNTLGQLYTLGGGDQGGRGTAVLFPHRFGYFGLGGSADTNEFIYVFQRMLSSLTLTK